MLGFSALPTIVRLGCEVGRHPITNYGKHRIRSEFSRILRKFAKIYAISQLHINVHLNSSAGREELSAAGSIRMSK